MGGWHKRTESPGSPLQLVEAGGVPTSHQELEVCKQERRFLISPMASNVAAFRPQVLVLCKLDRNFIPAQPKVLSFVSQLKAGRLAKYLTLMPIGSLWLLCCISGKGLALIYSVLEGVYTNNVAEASAAKLVTLFLSFIYCHCKVGVFSSPLPSLLFPHTHTQSLKRFSDENKIKGFCTVVAAPNVATTLPIM